MDQKTGQARVEGVYGVTSLSPQRATPTRLLALVRGQWQIENKSHWVRDVTFDEDRSHVRCGNIPQVMAALRNTAIQQFPLSVSASTVVGRLALRCALRQVCPPS